MIRKTNYYPTRAMAETYFEKRGVQNATRHVAQMMADGTIHFGLPPFKQGERPVTVDGGLRYAIYTEDAANEN